MRSDLSPVLTGCRCVRDMPTLPPSPLPVQCVCMISLCARNFYFLFVNVLDTIVRSWYALHVRLRGPAECFVRSTTFRLPGPLAGLAHTIQPKQQSPCTCMHFLAEERSVQDQTRPPTRLHSLHHRHLRLPPPVSSVWSGRRTRSEETSAQMLAKEFSGILTTCPKCALWENHGTEAVPEQLFTLLLNGPLHDEPSIQYKGTAVWVSLGWSDRYDPRIDTVVRSADGEILVRSGVPDIFPVGSKFVDGDLFLWCGQAPSLSILLT